MSPPCLPNCDRAGGTDLSVCLPIGVERMSLSRNGAWVLLRRELGWRQPPGVIWLGCREREAVRHNAGPSGFGGGGDPLRFRRHETVMTGREAVGRPLWLPVEQGAPRRRGGSPSQTRSGGGGMCGPGRPFRDVRRTR